MSQLAEKKCLPCRGDMPPLEPGKQSELFAQLDGWEIVENHHLRKTFPFSDFVSALNWVNAIGKIAEQENHHPDIELGWGYVNVSIWTHKIDNMTESDFVLAAKIDKKG